MLEDWLRQYLKEPSKSRNLKFHGHQFKSSYLDVFQRLSLFSIFLLLGFVLQAQPSSIQLEYDVTGFGRYYIKGILHYHKGKALFFVTDTLSETDRSRDSGLKEVPLTAEDIEEGTNLSYEFIPPPPHGKFPPQLMETDLNERVRLSRMPYEYLEKVYILKENIGAIEWNIKSGTKLIRGYNCQKVVGRFGGRKYTIWYTTEIPITIGPWKLDGLPGAVVEGFNNDRLTFALSKIRYDVPRPDVAQLDPTPDEIIYCQDIFRLEDENIQAEYKRLKATMGRDAGEIEIEPYFIQKKCD